MARKPSIRLPDYVPPSTELNFPPAETINRVGRRVTPTEMYSGFGAVIPVVYGEQELTGVRIVDPFRRQTGPGAVYGIRFAIALCWGGTRGIEQVLSVSVDGDSWVDFPPITSANAGAFVSTANVEMRAYDGRQTVVDPWLSEIPAGSGPGELTDTYHGIAYVAVNLLEFTPGDWQPIDGGMPDFRFKIRGRKCRDPETGLFDYTENPARHLLDFIEDSEFGPGRPTRGFEEAAQACDSLFNGEPRSRSGLVIDRPSSETDIINLMSAYAEVLWGFDGAAVSVIPDIPADPVDTIPASQIVSGTVRLSGVEAAQVPDAVRINFVDPGAVASTPPAEANAPGVVSPEAVSVVELPGVYRRSQALRMAYQRVRRLQAPGRIAWQMMGLGMQYEPGDIVVMPDIYGMTGLKVRITSQPEVIGPGQYQLQGIVYDDAFYPEED